MTTTMITMTTRGLLGDDDNDSNYGDADADGDGVDDDGDGDHDDDDDSDDDYDDSLRGGSHESNVCARRRSETIVLARAVITTTLKAARLRTTPASQ